MFHTLSVSDALRDLIPFVQLKKREGMSLLVKLRLTLLKVNYLRDFLSPTD